MKAWLNYIKFLTISQFLICLYGLVCSINAIL